MSSIAGGVTAEFQALQQASQMMQDVTASVAALRALATVPGAAASTGCPETGAAIGALGAEVVTWIVELVDNLYTDAVALEQNLSRYRANESSISSTMTGVGTGLGSKPSPTSPNTAVFDSTASNLEEAKTGAQVVGGVSRATGQGASWLQGIEQSAANIETAVANGAHQLSSRIPVPPVSGVADEVSTLLSWEASLTRAIADGLGQTAKEAEAVAAKAQQIVDRVNTLEPSMNAESRALHENQHGSPR